MTLAAPLWLLLLLPLAGLFWHTRRNAEERETTLRLPQDNTPFGGSTWRTWARGWLPYLRWIALVFIVLAMARPQKKWEQEKIKADAVDIVLALDISPSMLSRDFDPDRLSVAKKVAIEFVEKRPYDRLGLVAFAAEAFTQCPLTTDRRVVQTFIRELQVGRLEDGTAIGMGLATAVNRLKDSPSRSKVVILLTDGENNSGYIAPLQAADIAKTLGVRVYTVGIGTEGIVMSPAQRQDDGGYAFAPRYMMFDTELLREIARMTDGKFYRAYSEEDLAGIYDEIDRLEKTKIEVSTVRRTTDYFHWLIGVAVIFLLLEILGKWWLLRTATP
jgi:Ca-activated chloride channel family protein